jgi:hypothetical protein
VGCSVVTKEEAEKTLKRYVETFVKEEDFDYESMESWTEEFIEWLEQYTK